MIFTVDKMILCQSAALTSGVISISGNTIVTVTADNGTDSIYQTGSLPFYATVGAFGETAVDQNVIWTLSGQTSADTAIDADTGLLTVGADH